MFGNDRKHLSREILVLLWPFAAWIILMLVGANLIGGQLPQPDTIAGVNLGDFGDKVILIFQVLPGVAALLATRSSLPRKIALCAGYCLLNVPLFILFYFLSLADCLPNIHIFLEI